jgi:hypothetical protein
VSGGSVFTFAVADEKLLPSSVPPATRPLARQHAAAGGAPAFMTVTELTSTLNPGATLERVRLRRRAQRIIITRALVGAIATRALLALGRHLLVPTPVPPRSVSS